MPMRRLVRCLCSGWQNVGQHFGRHFYGGRRWVLGKVSPEVPGAARKKLVHPSSDFLGNRWSEVIFAFVSIIYLKGLVTLLMGWGMVPGVINVLLRPQVQFLETLRRGGLIGGCAGDKTIPSLPLPSLHTHTHLTPIPPHG